LDPSNFIGFIFAKEDKVVDVWNESNPPAPPQLNQLAHNLCEDIAGRCQTKGQLGEDVKLPAPLKTEIFLVLLEHIYVVVTGFQVDREEKFPWCAEMRNRLDCLILELGQL
jgi:hypothetical protein